MATKKVKETVDTVKAEAKTAAKKITKKAEPAVEAAKKTVKKVSEKTEPAVEAAKKTVKKVSEKTEPAVKKAKTAAKNAGKAASDAAKTAGKKVAAAIVPEVYVEFDGTKFDCSNIIDRCKADFREKHGKELIRSCKVYIKPEDGMAYYVINELADKIAL